MEKKEPVDGYLKNEKPFTGEELLFEIFPLLKDYFECELAIKDGAIEMAFFNGQKFWIKVASSPNE